MPLDKLTLYNQALFHTDTAKLSGLTENVAPRQYLDLHYDDVLKYMIEQGYWKFAMRSVSITADPIVSPAFGFTSAFNHPDDLVKVYQMSVSDRFDPPLENWIDESNLFWADEDTLYCRYVSNSSSGYGYDLTRWTGKFQLAVTLELAHRIAPRLPGSKVDMDDLRTAKDAARNEALSFEAMKEPPKRPPIGRWASARFRSRGRIDNRA